VAKRERIQLHFPDRNFAAELPGELLGATWRMTGGK